jgi:hypothetical protein
MQTILLSREKVARRARQFYKNSIRQEVETDENIRKMLIIDFESADYKVDETGLKQPASSVQNIHIPVYWAFA